jgi:hypothetical protein
MKFSLAALCICFLILSCGSDSAKKSFELTISADGAEQEILYVLNEKSLSVYHVTADSEKSDTCSILQSALNYTDTLEMIAHLDNKSFSCSEQHALLANSVRFQNDSTDFMVDPYVNHPKELDYAVRLINSIVSDDLHLQFIDMQGAIEPTNKHSM